MPNPPQLSTAIRAVGAAVREPEALALRWAADRQDARALIIPVLLASAVVGMASYGAFMQLHRGVGGMLSSAVRAPLAAGLAWAIALPALYIVGGAVGSKLSAGANLFAASVTVAFAGMAMLASIPVVWFFAVAVPEPEIHLAVHVLVFVGVGVCMTDVFMRVMAALEPDGGLAFRLGWLALVATIGLEMFLLFNVFEY